MYTYKCLIKIRVEAISSVQPIQALKKSQCRACVEQTK